MMIIKSQGNFVPASVPLSIGAVVTEGVVSGMLVSMSSDGSVVVSSTVVGTAVSPTVVISSVVVAVVVVAVVVVVVVEVVVVVGFVVVVVGFVDTQCANSLMSFRIG